MSTFKDIDLLLERLNIATTPIIPASKEPSLTRWQRLDLSGVERANRREKYSSHGIGVLAGTALPNGNLFGFVDVDHEGYLRFIKAVLGPFECAKFGAKGLTIFCQFPPNSRSKKFKPKRLPKPAIEVMAHNGMCVIPPSLHPSGKLYEWEGTPLWEVDLCALPLVDDIRMKTIQIVATNAYALEIVEGGPDIAGHEPMLRLASSGVAEVADE